MASANNASREGSKYSFLNIVVAPTIAAGAVLLGTAALRSGFVGRIGELGAGLFNGHVDAESGKQVLLDNELAYHDLVKNFETKWENATSEEERAEIIIAVEAQNRAVEIQNIERAKSRFAPLPPITVPR